MTAERGGVVPVTGAAGGVGTAMCQGFADAGYQVLATDSAGTDGAFPSIDADLRVLTEDPSALEDFRREVEQAGGGHLDVLVNNAATQILGGMEALSVEDFLHSQLVNVAAPFALARAFAPMLAERNGSIVNITSIHASATKPGFCAYATSKAALEGLTRALAVELGGRVRVNAISPAALTTAMLEAGFVGRPEQRRLLDGVHPSGRIGGPEEVARLAIAITDPALPFLTGAVIGLDGGIRGRLHDPL